LVLVDDVNVKISLITVRCARYNWSLNMS